MKIAILLILFMMLLVPVASAQAPPVPMPIAVKVLAQYPEGITVVVTNINSGDSKQATTSEEGEVIFDWSDLPYTRGNVFEVTVIGQKQSLTFDGTPLELLTFNLGACDWVNCPTCQDCGTDSTPYAQCNSCCEGCSVCPIQTPCQTPTQCEKPTGCPVCDQTVTAIILIIAGLILGAGGSVGIKMYKNTKGEVVNHHKHAGVLGYHDINIMHKNPLYRHAKGELSPKLPKSE